MLLQLVNVDFLENLSLNDTCRKGDFYQKNEKVNRINDLRMIKKFV